jgi:pyruvate/2-oxoglutarate dehydrogenase complex dihydrolipoamide dehydrogenase (E3) component
VVVLRGEAGFVDEKTVKVKLADESEVLCAAEMIFVNTGERPAIPQIPGLETVRQERVLDSTSIQELDKVPAHLIVLGGGYVGLEFAQLFRRLGSEVTLVQRGKQLLPREDPDVAKCMLDILHEDGLTIHLSTNEKGYIVVNEKLETTAPGVFALGDVKGPPAFTHISYDDFRIIRANHLTHPPHTSPATTTNRIVPYVVYTDPQLGHVGLHEAEARALGLKIKVASMPMSYVARALETDETRGMMKGIVDAETGKILGFTCLGIEGGEVMSLVQMAIMGGLGYEVLRDAVWAHPALAESLNNLWGFLK